ncbi:MAG: hypothetical protein ABIN48_08475 [Ginsengibacter sp.]
MSVNKVKLMEEHEVWRRSLELINQENALLKYKLSAIVDQSEGTHFLQTAEFYQNEFLKNDEWFKRLSADLQSVSAEFNSTSFEEIPVGLQIKLQDKLRKEIKHFEQEFFHLSHEFNQKIRVFFN